MTDTASLASRLEALGNARVVVIGDVMLDRFVYGVVERISPEGPIPVLRVDREDRMLGGAGNVQRNLSAAGATALLFSVVGEDEAGVEVSTLAKAVVGAEVTLVREAGRPTTIKDRFIAAGQHLLRTDREAAQALASATAKRLIDSAAAALTPGAVLVLSDYGKGVLDPASITAAIAAARAVGCYVVVDPKGRDYGIYRGADLVTPNLRELQDATGLPVGEEAEIVAACRALIETSGIGGVLATRSEKGMTLVVGPDHALAEGAPGGLQVHLGAEARGVYDVSGAGDTVVALVAAVLASGGGVVEAAQLANLAAGIVVGKVGTAVAHAGELLRSLHSGELLAAEDKVMDLASLLDRIAQWRQAGFCVGFTNGCFDLLHPGHVSLLAQARAACDRLIVGLNSDASVRRLKGDGRPVQSEIARAAVLASLESVNRVVVFQEETPLKLIDAIRPDVLIKGADYTVETVVGADVVQAYGGRVLLARLAPGHSTSETIRRLAE